MYHAIPIVQDMFLPFAVVSVLWRHFFVCIACVACVVCICAFLSGVAGGGDGTGVEHSPFRVPRGLRRVRGAPVPRLRVRAGLVSQKCVRIPPPPPPSLPLPVPPGERKVRAHTRSNGASLPYLALIMIGMHKALERAYLTYSLHDRHTQCIGVSVHYVLSS